MGIFLVVLIISLVLCIVACIGLTLDGGTIRTIEAFIGLIALVALIIASNIAYNRLLEYQKSKCANWGNETGYETKYSNISYGKWVCFAHIEGKWLPIDQIRTFEDN